MIIIILQAILNVGLRVHFLRTYDKKFLLSTVNLRMAVAFQVAMVTSHTGPEQPRRKDQQFAQVFNVKSLITSRKPLVSKLTSTRVNLACLYTILEPAGFKNHNCETSQEYVNHMYGKTIKFTVAGLCK